jgi:hypothetical protein
MGMSPEQLNAAAMAARESAASAAAEKIRVRRAATRGSSGSETNLLTPESPPTPESPTPDVPSILEPPKDTSGEGVENRRLEAEKQLDDWADEVQLISRDMNSIISSGSVSEGIVAQLKTLIDNYASYKGKYLAKMREAGRSDENISTTSTFIDVQVDNYTRALKSMKARLESLASTGTDQEQKKQEAKNKLNELDQKAYDLNKQSKSIWEEGHETREKLDELIRLSGEIESIIQQMPDLFVQAQEDSDNIKPYQDWGERFKRRIEEYRIRLEIIGESNGVEDVGESGWKQTEQGIKENLQWMKDDLKRGIAEGKEDYDRSYERVNALLYELEQVLTTDKLNEKEKRKLGERISEYKKTLADVRIQAIQNGFFGAQDLEEARKVLALAQKRVEGAQRLGYGLMRFIGGKSREQVSEELTKAQAEYEAKLQEATFQDRAVMLNERTKLAEAQIMAYRKGREGRTLYERYKGLSEINLDNALQRRGINLADKGLLGRVAKRGARMVNARTAISIGLFGGMVASGAYLGVGAGLAVARARGAWSGVGAGAGTYEMINLARRALSSSLSDKQINEMSADSAVQYMASYEARASLDGMDLSKNAEYQKLVARYKSAMEAKGKKDDGTELVGEELYESLKGELSLENTAQKKEISKERWIRRAAFVTGAVVGGTMYNWIVSKAQALAEARQIVEDQAAIARVARRSTQTGHDIILPKPVDSGADNQFIKYRPSDPNAIQSPLEKIQFGQQSSSEFPGMKKFNFGVDIKDLKTPGAGAVQEAAPAPAGAGAEAPIEPIRADMEVNVKPGGAITETPVAITEQSPVPKPDNVIYGEGLPETSSSGAIAEAKPSIGGAQTAVEGQSGAGVAEKIVKMRAGATMEIGQAGDAIVHAGERGIEGVLLDLKNADPERYAKMLAKLQEHYGTGDSGKAENLIHRFVIDYAKEHDLSVDAGSKDLSKIMSADIHISPDGELTMGDVKLMPPTEPSPSAGGLAQDTNPSWKGSSFDEGFDKPSPLEKFQFGGKPVAGLDSIPKPNFGVDMDDLHTPGELEESPIVPDSGDSLSEMTPAEAVQHAREVAAESILSPEKIAGKVEKLSDALHLVLGNKYDTFLDQIHMSAKSLNKVKDLTIGNFTEQIEDGAIDKKKFQGLIDAMVKWQEGGKISRANFDKMPIKKVMLEIAKFYKHNS